MDTTNDRGILDALESVAQALNGQYNQVDDDFCGFGKFKRNDPPKFKGRYDPEGTQTWPREIEKIF